MFFHNPDSPSRSWPLNNGRLILALTKWINFSDTSARIANQLDRGVRGEMTPPHSDENVSAAPAPPSRRALAAGVKGIVRVSSVS